MATNAWAHDFGATLGRVDRTKAVPFVPVLTHGTLLCGLYAPVGNDPQQPHTRDEVYVVVAGTGTFVCGEERTAFGPGHLLFVPAGVEHRFEEFSEDFATWVVFYGPEGGEKGEG